jgi:AraC-like DNA-binding protein
MFKLINDLTLGASFLLAFLLIFNPQEINKRANKWFGSFILCISFLILDSVLQNSNIKIENNILTFIINFPTFIIAPILYLSINNYINPTQEWNNKDFFHFSFGYLIILLALAFYFIFPNIKNEQAAKDSNHIIELLFNIIFCLQIILYFYLSYNKIIKHQKNVLLFSSTIERVDLNWLKYMFIGIIIMGGSWIIDILFQFGESIPIYNFICSLIYLLGILFIAYHSMKQKEIYPFNLKEKEELNEIISETDIPEENRKKLLHDDKLEEFKNKLIHLMDNSKPYLDCELSLIKLAALLDVSTHILSYIINCGFNENFYQFINHYRIEEAKRQILNPKMSHLSLLGIGFEVGFNSKTVFNTTFKKYTGLTPSEFKKAAY